VKVGDLIRLYDGLNESFSVGLICNVEEHGPNSHTGPGKIKHRYWTMWDDGEYSWIPGDENAVVISEKI
tara:strand:+ start:3512 stop:3718 length:207 start_codon:yes stop_codon:yes gene_type:complete